MCDEKNEIVDNPVTSPAPDNRSCEEICCYSIQTCIRNCYYKCLECLKANREVVFALVAGQILSLLLCGTAVASEALEQFYNVTAPTSQLFFTYLLLSIIFGPIVVCKKDFLQTLKNNWWKYIIIGVIDVEANYLVVLAYKYTNISSVQILDSFTLFTVLILSYIFLRARYLIIHLMGVALAVVGILSLVLVDFNSPHNEAGPNPLLGDLICLSGAILYAVSNVCQEYFVKNHSIFEWLGFLGTVGAVVSGIQLSVLERRNLAAVVWSTPACGSFILFIISLFLFYSLMPVVMKYSNAVVVNISLLTADVYAMVVGVNLFKQEFSFLYVVSFIIVVFGVFIFNLRPLPIAQPRIKLKDLKTHLLRTKRRKEQSKAAQDKNKEDSTLLNRAPRQDNDVETGKMRSSIAERQPGSLIRGPLEPRLDSISYSTEYSESMSYSYGSNSKEGSEILQKMNSKDGTKEMSSSDSDKAKIK